MNPKSVNQKSIASEAIQKITADDKTSKKDNLLSLIPEGQSPKLYIDLVKSQILGTDKSGNQRSDEDLMFFLYTAKRTGLDPLLKQIYAVYRWDTRLGAEKMTIQAGIDGFRLIAQRTGEYAGQDEVVFDPIDESLPHPAKASVTIYKMLKGARVPFTASARWSEYVQLTKEGKIQGLWSKMPYLMLGKCAESLALRKAFPNELSGLFSDVEMAQSNNVLADLPKPNRVKKDSEPVGEIKVIHGKPVDLKETNVKVEAPNDEELKATKKIAELSGSGDIGSGEAKAVSDSSKLKPKENPPVDITEIRRRIEEAKERERSKSK